MTTVTNLNSERHYREAYDYFYYMESSKFALLCVNKALNITPNHHKAWFLKGEIFLLENEVGQAIACFKEAEKCQGANNDTRSFANIAVCYEMLEDYENALIWCNKALSNICGRDKGFLPSLYQLRISALIKLKRHALAKKAFKEYSSYLFKEDKYRIKMSLSNIVQ
jgi:tetratricopeptide (TPR) repeat protein